MTLTPQELRDSGKYSLLKELSHDKIIGFVIAQMKQLRWPIAFFYLFNVVLLALMMLFTAGNIIHSYISWGLYWMYLGIGVVLGMLVVIPFHEMVHGLAYKLSGAPMVKFGADMKQMLFYASAPGFVAGKHEFFLVAFSPFVLINLLFLAGIVFGSPEIQWGFLVAIFMHSTMCVGDFAMANYFASFPGKKVYTYDDKSEKRSYFFVRH